MAARGGRLRVGDAWLSPVIFQALDGGVEVPVRQHLESVSRSPAQVRFGLVKETAPMLAVASLLKLASSSTSASGRVKSASPMSIVPPVGQRDGVGDLELFGGLG